MLLLIYKLPPAAAAATSLFVILLNATSGSISYWRQRRIDLRIALLLAAPTIPGALIGPAIAERLPDRTFKIVFSLFMLSLAGFLVRRQRPVVPADDAPPPRRWTVHRTYTTPQGETVAYRFNLALALVISFGVGVLSSVLGIGGGIVHVPAMIHLMSFPVHIATATSQLILVITSATGVAEYASRGHIVWRLGLAIGVGVVIGAQIGAALSRRMREKGIVRLLAVAIVLLAVRLLWSGVRG